MGSNPIRRPKIKNMEYKNHWKLTPGKNLMVPMLMFGGNRTQFMIVILGFSFTFGIYKQGKSEL